MSVDIIGRMRASFRVEALELLAELDAALLVLESEPGNDDLVHRVFRAIHTIKGSGATAGYEHLAAVAHKVEEAFDLARSGRLAITGELVDCGLKACDVLRSILDSDNPDEECPGERVVQEALTDLLPRSTTAPESGTGSTEGQPGYGDRVAYEITVRPHRDLFYSGTDPVTLLG
jgi:two-component system chemotaxis sensor kinase CheA